MCTHVLGATRIQQFINACFPRFIKHQCSEYLDGKTVIVTGANTGLGKQTALECAKRNARVIMACRNLEKAEAAAKVIRDATKDSGKNEVVVRELDLSSFKSVRKFCARINEEEPHLNILVNNAGVYRCPSLYTEDEVETHFQVNHLGHFLLTTLLLDLLKKSAPSRIVVLSSFMYKDARIDFEDINWKVNYNGTEAYKSSKLANVWFCRELSKRLEGSGVNVYCVNPGIVLTDIMRHTVPQFFRYFDCISRLFFKTPAQGAQTTLYCILFEKLQNESGYYYSNCSQEDLNSNGLNEDGAKRLWEVSEKAVESE
ncbi:retinol dehydrogenase 14-like [Octopus bimaculoides]|uniref:Retinol dehydrogenase 14 n=1 Tax=Octopus bimaculoides TaxID=37653 RepID=A0A0L8I7Y3_OCTBM|nr:retinol dehydrogenase 14-like [Octopus bimaculoides]